MKIAVHLLLFIAFSINVLEAQKVKSDFDPIYGLDPILYNGKDYTFFVSSSIEGHQFFESEKYFKGSVIIKGNEYENLSLNYDIYNHQLLLKYNDARGAINIVEISKAWLESFKINGYYFELMKSDDYTDIIFQVVGVERIRLLINWQKRMKLKTESVSSYYFFSKPQRSVYVLNNNQLTKVKKKRDFLSVFNIEAQIDIKKYFKQQKIKLKKASISEMEGLMKYCNTL